MTRKLQTSFSGSRQAKSSTSRKRRNKEQKAGSAPPGLSFLFAPISPSEAAEAPEGAGAVSSLPSDALKAAREAAEASGEALPVFVTRAAETQAQRDSLTRKMKKAPDFLSGA